MYVYSMKNCLDNHFCPEQLMLHEKEFSKEEFYTQILTSVVELRNEPFECDHQIRNLFRKMIEKKRPVDFSHVIQKMCDKYGYQMVSGTKHSYALWQTKTKIIKEVGEHHTDYYRDVDSTYLTRRFLGSAGNGGFWDDDNDF